MVGPAAGDSVKKDRRRQDPLDKGPTWTQNRATTEKRKRHENRTRTAGEAGEDEQGTPWKPDRHVSERRQGQGRPQATTTGTQGTEGETRPEGISRQDEGVGASDTGKQRGPGNGARASTCSRHPAPGGPPKEETKKPRGTEGARHRATPRHPR